jgi:hypothetical protein
MVVNKSTIIGILLALGLVVGGGLIWAYQTYKDDVADFAGIENKDEVDITTDEYDIPFFGSSEWTFGYGPNGEWKFYIFQPTVDRYTVENGLNYLIVKYTFDDPPYEDEELHEMKVLLTREDDWSLDGDLDSGAFERAIGDTVAFVGSYNNQREKSAEESELTLEEFKERFPVGSSVAMAYPGLVVDKERRTDELCEAIENICDFALVWDELTVSGLQTFNYGGYPSDDFVLVPYSFSDDIFRWSEEGEQEKRDLEEMDKRLRELNEEGTVIE